MSQTKVVENVQYGKDEAAQYDFYRKKNETSFRTLFAKHVMSSMRPEKKVVFDFGCGTEPDARWMLEDNDVAQVVGIDISPAMLTRAHVINADLEPRVSFRVADCCNPAMFRGDASADIAYSGFMLIHAESESMLRGMLESMYECLRPGGICLALTMRPECTEDEIALTCKQIGMDFQLKSRNVHTGKQVWRARFLGTNLEVDNHVYTYATYEALFESAGFDELHVIYPDKSDLGSAASGYLPEFIDTFLHATPYVMFYAEKHSE